MGPQQPQNADPGLERGSSIVPCDICGSAWPAGGPRAAACATPWLSATSWDSARRRGGISCEACTPPGAGRRPSRGTALTDLDRPADGPAPRRRTGGRQGHDRPSGPPQRPWAQPRLRYAPTEVVSADELESIHIASLRILSEIGMDFLDVDAREALRAAGAETSPDTQRVRFDPAMVLERIATAPSAFTLHATNPAHHLRLGEDWMAFGTVGSPPNVSDLDRGRRIGNREDYQNLLRLGQSLTPVHFLAGYPVEPVDLHHGVRHLHATFDALTLMDKAHPLLQPRPPAQCRRPRDGAHRARHR